jgi:hypothetical protein
MIPQLFFGLLKCIDVGGNTGLPARINGYFIKVAKIVGKMYLKPEIPSYSFFTEIDNNKFLTYTQDRFLYEYLEAL